MSKILVGMAAAALWFVLSQAANAERHLPGGLRQRHLRLALRGQSR